MHDYGALDLSRLFVAAADHVQLACWHLDELALLCVLFDHSVQAFVQDNAGEGNPPQQTAKRHKDSAAPHLVNTDNVSN